MSDNFTLHRVNSDTISIPGVVKGVTLSSDITKIIMGPMDNWPNCIERKPFNSLYPPPFRVPAREQGSNKSFSGGNEKYLMTGEVNDDNRSGSGA